MSKTLKRRTNSKKRLVKRNKKHTNMRKTKNVKRRRGGSGDCNSDICYYEVDSATKQPVGKPHRFWTGTVGEAAARCIRCNCSQQLLKK